MYIIDGNRSARHGVRRSYLIITHTIIIIRSYEAEIASLPCRDDAHSIEGLQYDLRLKIIKSANGNYGKQGKDSKYENAPRVHGVVAFCSTTIIPNDTSRSQRLVIDP